MGPPTAAATPFSNGRPPNPRSRRPQSPAQWRPRERRGLPLLPKARARTEAADARQQIFPGNFSHDAPDRNRMNDTSHQADRLPLAPRNTPGTPPPRRTSSDARRAGVTEQLDDDVGDKAEAMPWQSRGEGDRDQGDEGGDGGLQVGRDPPWRWGAIIRKPTRIRAGAVAAAGTTPATGAASHRERNSSPTKTECRPARAPSATPAADSTYAVTLPAPRAPPRRRQGGRRSGSGGRWTRPAGSTRPACSARRSRSRACRRN